MRLTDSTASHGGHHHPHTHTHTHTCQEKPLLCHYLKVRIGWQPATTGESPQSTHRRTHLFFPIGRVAARNTATLDRGLAQSAKGWKQSRRLKELCARSGRTQTLRHQKRGAVGGLGPPATHPQRRDTRTSSPAPAPHRLWPAVTYGPRNCRPSPQLQQTPPRVRRAQAGPTGWACHRWPWLLRAHWLQSEKAHLDAVCLASGVPPCSRCNPRGAQGTGRASDRTQLG